MDPEKKVFALMVRTIPSFGHDTAATVVATATERSSDARSKSDLIFLKDKCLENSLIMASVWQREVSGFCVSSPVHDIASLRSNCLEASLLAFFNFL